MGALGELSRAAGSVGRYVLTFPLHCRDLARAGSKEAAMRLAREHPLGLLERAGVTLETSGHEHIPEGGCVITYNEAALPDLLALNAAGWGEIGDRMTAAPVWGKLPYVRRGGDLLGVSILPTSRREVDALLDDLSRHAADGERVMWGGEGGLSGRDGVNDFKTGCARIAIRAQRPLVPMTICGGHRLMPLGSYRMRPGTIKVALGPPIDTTGMVEETDAKALAARARDAVAELYASVSQSLPTA